MAHLGLEEPLTRKRRSEGSGGFAGDLAGAGMTASLHRLPPFSVTQLNHAGDMDAKRLNLDLSRGLGGSLEDPSNAERDGTFSRNSWRVGR